MHNSDKQLRLSQINIDLEKLKQEEEDEGIKTKLLESQEKIAEAIMIIKCRSDKHGG